MGPEAREECHGLWSELGCEAHVDRCPSPEEPSPRDGADQAPTKGNPRKVFPEPPTSTKIWSEKDPEVPSKRRGHLEDQAQRTSEASARDHCDNASNFDKHVSGQRISLEGSCKIDIPELRKHLLKREAESEGVEERASFFWMKIQLVFWTIRWCMRVLQCLFYSKRKDGKEKATGKGLESLPGDLQAIIYQRLTFQDLTHAKAVSKTCKNVIDWDAFLRSRRSSGEGEFTVLNFFVKNSCLQCTGYDLRSNAWQRLPTPSGLPKPDLNLFKANSVCGHGGLMCANVSESPDREKIVVFNILTGEKKDLPPLHYSRYPVLLHIWEDAATGFYMVIAAGSASSSKENNLSRRIEVYDSRTSEWTVGSDIPGPEFGLNEHQAGVCVNMVLYFVAFLEGDGRKGIVAFDMETGKWLHHRTLEVPFSRFCNTLQLLESSGKLYLFSEQERDGVVVHCVDVVELCDWDGEGFLWRLRTVVRVTKADGRGLSLYPEFTCVPFGNGKLCLFNTIKRDGELYDTESGKQLGVLQPPPENQRGDNFFFLNPVSFTLAPNYVTKP